MKIKYTKNGQAYKILANGRARFIKTSSTKRKKNNRGVSMAKKKSYFSRRKSGLSGLTATILGAGIYGALRERMSNALAPVTAKIPLGNISDEVGMGLALILAKKFIGRKVPMIKQVADAGITIEAARIGVAIANGEVMNSSSNVTNEAYLYG